MVSILSFFKNSLGELSLNFTLGTLQCMINSYILTTKQLISCRYYKEKMDIAKLAGAERVE